MNILNLVPQSPRLVVDDISQTVITASTDMEIAIKELRKLNKAIKKLESTKAKIVKQVKDYMTFYGTLSDIDDNVLATYKYSAGAARLDSKQLALEHPKLYKKYTIFGEPVRKFLIKEEI